MEDLFNSFLAAVKAAFLLPVILLPQSARNDTAHIEVLFQNIDKNGGEKLTLLVTFVTSGTHKKWLEETAKAKRSLIELETSGLTFALTSGIKLDSYWSSNSNPGWVYPDNDETAMPVRYEAPYMVEINYPTRIIQEA